MAEKREVGQTQSQRPKSPMKWRFKSRKTVPAHRDWMGWDAPVAAERLRLRGKKTETVRASRAGHR